MGSILHLFFSLKPERFFLVAGGIFGLFFLFLTPPFQVPDEPNHFYRAWQISEGGFLSEKKDKRIGGNLPVSLEKITQPFSNMMWWKNQKLSNIPFVETLKIPLNTSERKFYDFNNSALYSPVCYFPAATALFICRLFDTSPLYSFYWARLMMLAFWILLIYYALKIIPIYKWLFTFLTLLPMSVFMNMSINADVVTNAVSFLFIASVLNSAYGKTTFSRRDLFYYLLIIFLLASVKTVYTPLLLLLVIIPKSKFKSTDDWLLRLILLAVSGFVFTAFWNFLLKPLYLSYQDYNPDFRNSAALVNGADIPAQAEYVKSQGFGIFKVFTNSLQGSFDMYYNGYIGMFGWLEKSLAPWFVNSAYVLLLFFAIFENDTSVRIYWWQKLIITFTFLIIFLLVFLSQYLLWVPVGGELILNIQGRYLIPCIPLLLILFYNRIVFPKNILLTLSVLVIITSLIYCTDILYSRYH